MTFNLVDIDHASGLLIACIDRGQAETQTQLSLGSPILEKFLGTETSCQMLLSVYYQCTIVHVNMEE